MKLKAIVEIEAGDDPTKCSPHCHFDWGIKCSLFMVESKGVRCPACLAATEMAERLVEALFDTIWQICYLPDDDILDSMATSSYASALRLLAELGKIKIIDEYGRRVIAKYIEEKTDGD